MGIDHGSLLGLGHDDHPQYATDADLLAHRTASPIDHPDGSVTSRKARLTSATAAGTADVVVGTTEVGIPGASVGVTLEVASIVVVWSTFDVNITTLGIFVGRTYVGVVVGKRQALSNFVGRVCVSNVNVFSLAAGTHTFRLTGMMTAGSAIVNHLHTQLTCLVLSNV